MVAVEQNHSPISEDLVQRHQATWNGFARFAKYGIFAVIAVLALMALFLL